MATIKISDLPVGSPLFLDKETYLDELDDERRNQIYGGYCAPTPYTPIVLCAAPPEPIAKTPPVPMLTLPVIQL